MRIPAFEVEYVNKRHERRFAVLPSREDAETFVNDIGNGTIRPIALTESTAQMWGIA